MIRTYGLTRFYVQMSLRFTIKVTLQLPRENLYIMRDCNSLEKTSLKRKREERRFVDIRIVLMLHCGSELLQ